MANIKPIVTVSLDGKVDVIGKRLGINKTISYIWSKMEEFKIDKTIRFTLCLHMVQKIVRNWSSL